MKMFIDGAWIEAGSGKTLSSVNPANGRVFDQFPAGGKEDVEAAVDAASRALKAWSATPASQRAEYVLKAGLLIREHLEEIALTDTTEVGKPIREARREVNNGATACVYFSGLARRLYSNVVDSEQPLKHAMVIRRPVGVVGVITPWNDPVSLAAWGIAPALVAGNTVVFKPSSSSTIVSGKLVEIFQKTGLPKGVLNMVTGKGSEAGEALITNTDIRMTVFTGESATGKHIAQVNAPLLRKQVMELGGKNPLIVASDANVDVTVHAALYAAFSSAGQKCTAASRIIVEEGIAEEFTKKFVAGAQALKVGNGAREDVDMGPVISRNQQEKILKYVDIGKNEGAKILAGGGGYTDEERREGFFVQPTVFGDVSNDMKIAQEEIFGPVTAIIAVKNIDEAIEVANQTRYGLSSAIYTRNITNMFKAIQGIEAGLTFINQGSVGPEVGAPFGGVKDSGYGRELGEEALEHFTEKKTVYVDYSDADRPWFFGVQRG